MRVLFVTILWLSVAAGGLFAQGSTQVPDAIFYNGKIITVDSGFSTHEAFAVKGDKFLAVGSNAEIRALAGPKSQLVDLGGHTVIPGLIDGHNHQYRAASLLLRGVDMSRVHSLAEMLSSLKEASADTAPGQTVFTNADWNVQAFPEKRAPTRQELDDVSNGHPLIIQTTRGQAYLNSLALKALGITRDTKTFVGWPVPKDSSGEPTGSLSAPVGPTLPQSLQEATSRLIPPPTDDEKKQLILKEQALQNALGITGVREVWLAPDVMRTYQELELEHKLTIRVSMGVTAFGSTPPADLEKTLQTWGVGTEFGDHWLRLDDVGELQVDGSVENAFLREPFADPPGNYYGALIATETPENLRQLISIVDRYNWRPSTHIWGDKALDVTMDAYEAAEKEQGSIHEKRWTVEHAVLIHGDQMDRLARMGVLVSVQAQPYYQAKTMLQSWGEARANEAVPVRELLDHKLRVGSGSDWPSLPQNPFVNIYFYVTRNTQGGGQLGVSQKVSRKEALQMATINNAYMTFEEDVKGSIEPGKLADFLILSQDVLTAPEEQIPTIHPLATYVGGLKVFSSKEGSF